MRSSRPLSTSRPDDVPPEPRSRPLEGIRFYVDEDILGIGYAAMWLRSDVITCGIGEVAMDLPRQIADVDWIPRVTARGWIAVTGNRKIRTNPVEAGVAAGCRARIICFAGSAGNRTSWDKVGLLIRHWAAIENMIEPASQRGRGGCPSTCPESTPSRFESDHAVHPRGTHEPTRPPRRRQAGRDQRRASSYTQFTTNPTSSSSARVSPMSRHCNSRLLPIPRS